MKLALAALVAVSIIGNVHGGGIGWTIEHLRAAYGPKHSGYPLLEELGAKSAPNWTVNPALFTTN